MEKMQGVVHDLPKVSGQVMSAKGISGGIGAKIINIGKDGATFVPSVSEDGVLSWSNNQDLPNPDPVSVKGKSAYQISVDNGFRGTESEWLESLHGKNGYTPQKGVDYFDGKDGYTPVKGVDYFDGKNGQDGYTPRKNIDYFDGKDGAPGRDGKDGYTPVKGVDYFDGKDGKDGQPGAKGDPGYTPQRGVDYYTAADKAAMVSEVLAALPVYDGSVVDV